MVLDKLGENLRNTLKKITKAIFVDEALINELIRDIQRALLSADVNVQLVLDLTNKIKKRVLEEKPPTGISQKEFLIKIVYEELVNILEKKEKGIRISKKPFKIMFVGLFGSGKTTSIGKVAKYYTKRGYKVCSLGLDVHRPGAMDQLEQISKQIKIPCFTSKEKDALEIYKKFENDLKKFDIVLIDTAGRDALSDDLIKEISRLNKEIRPDENILVISADIGQAAKEQAKKFHESCNITGVLISKLDGTAKAGGALTAASETNAKIKFIGTGEKMDDLETFNPEGFVSRLLGMGDLKALLEKAQEAIDQETAQDLGKKFLKGDFNFLDLYEQMQAMRKMGPLSKIMELIPGLGSSIPKEMLDVQDEKLKRWKYIFQSCTKEELENPDILFNRSRIERVAKGAGVTTKEIRELLKQYRQTKKIAKLMKGMEKEQDFNKLMRKFKGKLPKGFKI